MRKALLACVLAFAAFATTSAPASNAPVTWSFDVTFDTSATGANGAPTWTGTASGPGSGTIAVVLLASELRGQALHVELEVEIDAGMRSSTVALRGVFNEVTTRGVFNGVVTDGWLEGARAHQRAARVDPASPAALTGSLMLMTGSAG
jgi:hypothetical protein